MLAGGYGPADILGDVVAGLTVVLTVIPQGIGYMSLAGLDLQVSRKSTFPGFHFEV